MQDDAGQPAPGGADGSAPLRPFIPVSILLPTLLATLGIDGGALFQILAAEDLGLGAGAIGVAFGFGVASVPLQLWAARLPLWRARRHLRLFFGLGAVLAALLAALVARGPGGPLPVVALVITVLAEISLSVLFATAWQPLLAHSLSSVQRQLLSSRASAIGRALLAVSVVGFGALASDGRVAFVAVVAVAFAWLAVQLRRVRPPPYAAAPAEDDTVTSARAGPLPGALHRTFVLLAVTGLGAWPLFLVYTHDALWPSAPLGVLGALQLAGILSALLAWRPTTGSLLPRARGAVIGLLASALLLATVRAPVQPPVEPVLIGVAVFGSGAGISVVRLALLEIAHRSVEPASAVRAFTLLDVVASTSVQAGLLVGGVLASLAANTDWVLDPYRLYLVVCAGAAVLPLRHFER